MVNVRRQVFLGGASGTTTWRKTIAIPILEAAGVTYFDPQLPPGAWTEECQAAEMKAKSEADVLLFVINEETRGVASIAEASFYLGTRRALALVVVDIGENAVIEGERLQAKERKDLNRGRIFVRTMAEDRGVPVFADVERASRYAVQLAQAAAGQLTVGKINAVLNEIEIGAGAFSVEQIVDGFLLHLSSEESDVDDGVRRVFAGREWFIGPSATESEIVRTAFKAVVTWQEHEARDRFQFRGARPFSAHLDVDDLVELYDRQRRTRGAT